MLVVLLCSHVTTPGIITPMHPILSDETYFGLQESHLNHKPLQWGKFE